MSATASLDQVRHLRQDIGLSESELADATGASTRTVRRWTNTGTYPQRGHRDQIDDLSAIVRELHESLTPKGIRQWLFARNRYLKGKRPIDVLRQEGFDEVYDAAVAFRDGVYL